MKKTLRVVMATTLLCSLCSSLLSAQGISGKSQFPSTPYASVNTAQDASAPASDSHAASDPHAEEELLKGTALTRHGDFSEAIPHLLAARGKVSNQYATNFNLALCYVGTREYKQAIQILNDLHREGNERADVENLLAQAYVGSGQSKEALASLEKAAAITPQNEKLYLYVADACNEHQDYPLALKVIAIGLRNMTDSARLHYERGILLSNLDEFDRAKADFEFVEKVAAGSEIGYVAEAQKNLLEGDVTQATQVAREGIKHGFKSPMLLTLLGEALLRSGATPGQAEFREAQAALEQAVAERPNDPSSQIALGQLYLASGRSAEAIEHLQKAKQLQPDRPIVYANLAKAYQRQGDEQAAQQALTTLEKLNLARAEQIRSAPGDRKMSYGGESHEEMPPKQ